MIWLAAFVFAAVGTALVLSRIEIARLKHLERELLSREAVVHAKQAVADERTTLETAKIRQAFEEGIIEGLKQSRLQEKADGKESYQMGYEKGLLEGEKRSEDYFRIEHWTEVTKNQGYFFTSAEIVACYQLMYKNIPLGVPQRHTLEKSETVDRVALNRMVDQVLGQTALAPGARDLQSIRVVSRGEELEKPREIGTGRTQKGKS